METSSVLRLKGYKVTIEAYILLRALKIQSRA